MNGELSPPVLQRPTRVRFGVLGFVCALSMITYLDRVCMGASTRYLVEALGLRGVEDLKWAFTAFTLSYASFEIPTGWLGDVIGPRSTLIRIVLWWSVFTALTGLVGMTLPGGLFLGLYALFIIRFLFGLGEAGAYPNITRALHNWFPFQERGAAQGAVWFAGRLMGGLTPLVLGLLIEGLQRKLIDPTAKPDELLIHPLLDWRQAFWSFGAIGTVWCILFALWFRNRPREKPSVNAAELAIIGEQKHAGEDGHSGVPWRRIVTSGNLWALCLMYFCASYGWYFFITYYFNFLEEQYGVDPRSLAGWFYKGGPLLIGALACLTGGLLTDRFIRRTGNRKWGRRLFGVCGHGLCAVCFMLSLAAPSALWFFVAGSMASFFNDMTMGSAWATCQDIGRRYAAIVAGCMNTIGNLGGAAAGFLTGEILHLSVRAYATSHGLDADHVPPDLEAAAHALGYQINLLSFAGAYVVAMLLWLRVDSTKPVTGEDKAAPVG
ncbi:MAG TPA: MFS transporter [Gemmataceae bacterium]|nr:MFS transporter [Gemmataceae bacterium]